MSVTHPIHSRRLIVPAAALLLALLSCLAAAPASAAPNWAIRASANGQATHYRYDIQRGSSVTDSVLLYNFDSQPVTISLYGVDLVSARGGGLAPLYPTQRQHGVGLWLHLATTAPTIPANAHIEITFTLSVPAQVLPGDYFGAIVAAGTIGTGANNVHIGKRLALALHVSVPGAIQAGIQVGALVAVASGQDEHFQLMLGNTGNVLYSYTGLLAIEDSSGHVLQTIPMTSVGNYVIPGGSQPLTAVWRRIPLIGHYTAVATVRATIGATPYGPYRTPPFSLFFFPTPQVLMGAAILLGLLLFIVLTWRWWRDRYRATRRELALFGEFRQRQRISESALPPGGVDDAEPSSDVAANEDAVADQVGPRG